MQKESKYTLKPYDELFFTDDFLFTKRVHLHAVIGEPLFESYGQIHFRDAESMRQEFSEAVRKALKHNGLDNGEMLRKQISLRCKELLRQYMHSASPVLTLITRLP